MQTEFEEAGSLLETNRDAVTISIEDGNLKPEKQRKSAGYSPEENDGDPEITDDKTEVWPKLKMLIFVNLSNIKSNINMFFVFFLIHFKASLWAKAECPFLDVRVLPKIFWCWDPSRNDHF